MQSSILYPVVFRIPRAEKTSRLLMLLRPFMLIPIGIWVGIVGMAAGFLGFLSFWAIIITGRYPRSFWEFNTRYLRRRIRVSAYTMLLCDVYPPFSGEEGGYPVEMRIIYPESLSRLTVFFRPLICFPQFFFLMVFSWGYAFISFLTFWSTLVIGRIPDAFWNFLTRYFVYVGRLNAYMMFLVDEYPPFNGRQSIVAEQEFGGTAAG
jgi:hypothetical protein